MAKYVLRTVLKICQTGVFLRDFVCLFCDDKQARALVNSDPSQNSQPKTARRSRGGWIGMRGEGFSDQWSVLGSHVFIPRKRDSGTLH